MKPKPHILLKDLPSRVALEPIRQGLNLFFVNYPASPIIKAESTVISNAEKNDTATEKLNFSNRNL
jgi:hypothetical protein